MEDFHLIVYFYRRYNTTLLFTNFAFMFYQVFSFHIIFTQRAPPCFTIDPDYFVACNVRSNINQKTKVQRAEQSLF